MLNAGGCGMSTRCAARPRCSVLFVFKAEDGIRDLIVTGVQTCAFLFSSRRRHTRSDRDWSSDVCSSDLSELRDMIRTIVAPHEADNGRRRLSIKGPPIHCGEHASNSIALIFHELATNAVKYGALREEEGHIVIDWRCEDGNLILHWIERGGPPIEMAPETLNFGSTLVQNTVTRRFNGTLDCEWPREGMMATITIPIERLSV